MKLPKWLRQAAWRQRQLRRNQPRITSEEAQRQFDRVTGGRVTSKADDHVAIYRDGVDTGDGVTL